MADVDLQYIPDEHKHQFRKFSKFELTIADNECRPISDAKYRSLVRQIPAKITKRLTDNPVFSLIDNTRLVMIYKGETHNVSLSPSLYEIIIELLRSANGEHYKVRIYPHGEKIWAKLYLNPEHLADLCDRYYVAPRTIRILSQKLGIDYKNCSIDITNQSIKAFQNVNEPVLGHYVKYIKLTPYCYQHNNTNWLLGIEANVRDNNHKLEFVNRQGLMGLTTRWLGNIYLDPQTYIMYNENSLWECKTRYVSTRLYGGVLCDEVGLGKTLSMVSLILADKYSHLDNLPTIKEGTGLTPVSPPVEDHVAPSKVKISIMPTKSKPTIKLNPKLQLEPKVRPNETKLEAKTDPETETKTIKPKVKLNPMKKVAPLVEAYKDDNIPPPQVNSKCSLVICPRRLVGQWVSEISKYTDKLNVVEMSTMNHVKKYIPADFMVSDIDIVVASFSLLENKNYRSQTEFQLHQVNWKRVIVDEGHEVLLHNLKKRIADVRISTSIFNIKSTYRWVCTGTPLPSTRDSLDAIISYLAGYGHNQICPILDNLNKSEIVELLGKLFHKNTRESIKKYVEIPGVINHTDFLDFTATERTIYDGASEEDNVRKLQLCTNINVSDQDSAIIGGMALNLDEVNKAMAKYNQELLEKYGTELVRIQENIETLTTERDEFDDDCKDAEKDLRAELKASSSKVEREEINEKLSLLKEERRKTMSSYRGRIKTLEDREKTLEKDIAKAKKQLQIFRSLTVSSLQQQSCAITGRPLSMEKVAISPQGHYFSESAIKILFAGSKKCITCPFTGQQLETGDLYYVDPVQQTKDNAGDKIDMERSRWGTKLAFIVKKLRKLFDEPDEYGDIPRVIIFSQWSKMLLLVSHVLRDSNISYVFCRGNVNCMSRSIKTFKEDPSVRVILLSSDSCSSGSNLTEANHIFLLDGVGKDIHDAKAIEEQAIGRAKRIGQNKVVHVHRFVIKDTIEDEFYKKLDICTEQLITGSK